MIDFLPKSLFGTYFDCWEMGNVVIKLGSMWKMFTAARLHAFFCSVFLLAAASTGLFGQDRFILALGDHGDLIVSAPNGEKVGDFPAPTISQPVTIAGVASFEMSYGRDVNNMLTAIISPNPSEPGDLHFTVLNKRIDADKQAVITLTFSASEKRVTVDPGYIGVVQVDSQNVSHQPHVARKEDEVPATPALPDTAVSAAPASSPSDNPVGRAVQPTTIRLAEPVSTSTAQTQPRLFWAEPVISPDGSTPHVASNEMKLVAVHGSVSVKTPDGTVEHGANGMLVPSGSTVSTAAASSAAVFAGGINSARIMPDSNISVTQNMEGTVRHTTVDLQKGTVFSRVGKRAGETQNYEVRTADGVAAARGTEYVVTLMDGVTLVFVNSSKVDLFVNGAFVTSVIGHHGHIGHDAMGTPKPTEEEFDRALNEILTELQPFNTALIKALFDYESGTPLTAAEQTLVQEALYGALVVFNDVQTAYYLDQGGAQIPISLRGLLSTADATPTQTQVVTQFSTPADESTSGPLPPAH
jgi:hypothetical protein